MIAAYWGEKNIHFLVAVSRALKSTNAVYINNISTYIKIWIYIFLLKKKGIALFREKETLRCASYSLLHFQKF